MYNDIENNMDEIIIPEITKEDLIQLNDEYFKTISCALDTYLQYDIDELEEIDAEHIKIKELKYNELMNQNIDIIEKLAFNVSNYEDMEITQQYPIRTMEHIEQYLQNRITKRLFYFNEINPLLNEMHTNLNEIISILESDESSIESDEPSFFY
jgi:hypothetical protein